MSPQKCKTLKIKERHSQTVCIVSSVLGLVFLRRKKRRKESKEIRKKERKRKKSFSLVYFKCLSVILSFEFGLVRFGSVACECECKLHQFGNDMNML